MTKRNLTRSLWIVLLLSSVLFFLPNAFAADDDEVAEAASESESSDSSTESAEAPAPAPAPAPQTSSSASDPATSRALGLLSKLQVHGFLTQAYAESNFLGRPPNPDGTLPGPTAQERSLGIPESGTTDYRNLAIQFRYSISKKDTMIIQLSSRAIGDSPITEIEDEIELDWAIYERRITDNTTLKIGRVLIPFGIFNEVRDVGTVLPFFRPPFVFYREGSFTNETVDGALVSHTFGATSDWSVDVDLYGGEWDAFEAFGPGPVFPSRNKDSWGGQLWLNTPVLGLRWGLGFQRRNTFEGVEGVLRPIGGSTRFDDVYTSIDGVFNKFVARAEFRTFKNRKQDFPLPGFVGKFQVYYAQFGYHPTEKFRIYFQWEEQKNFNDSTILTGRSEVKPWRDAGIALNYLLSPSVVIKAEYHDLDGEEGTNIPTTPQGPPFRPGTIDLDSGSYFIISLSASF